MCKMKDVTVGIRDLNFTARRGKMLVRLTDGREVLIPFPSSPTSSTCRSRSARSGWCSTTSTLPLRT